MNNNPMQMIMQMMQGGGFNPDMFMQQFGGNPMFQQAQKMAEGKTPEQLMKMINNIAQQKGIDMNQLKQMANQFGIKF